MIRKLLLGAVVAVFVVAASGCGGSRGNSSPTTHTLTDLHSIGQLQRAFNSAADEPRLVVIISPT